MAIWDLDSRSVYGHPSMSPYDQKIKQLIDATPFWEKDGGGIRGRTIAPLLGGSSGSNTMEEALPQQFNQQTNRSFAQQEEGLPDLILPSMGGGDPVAHPFQVRIESDNDGNPTYIIELNSNLYRGLRNFEKQNITWPNFPSTPSEGFLSLFGVVSNGVVTSASIQGPEAVPSDRIDFVSSQQTSFNYLIAYLFKAGDSWKVRQLCFQDLTLIDICVNGVPCRYPFAV